MGGLTWLWFVLAGLAGGVLGGMGMGGGTLLIPILTIFLDVPQRLAAWLNLVTFIPMSIIALIIHVKNKLVAKKRILPVLIPAVGSAIGASFLATAINMELLRKLFGGFLTLLGIASLIYMLIDFVKTKKQENSKNPQEKKKCKDGAGNK